MAFRIFCAFLALNLFGFNTAATSPVESLRLRAQGFAAPASFELLAHWSGPGAVIVESSFDLKNWAYEWLSPSGAAAASFTDTAAFVPQKFYRARDYVLHFAGSIRDIETQAPVTGASLRLSFTPGPEPEIVSQSDAAGAFRFTVPPAGAGNFQMRIDKPGYEPLTIYGHYGPYLEPLPMRLVLAPPGYRPPNDDFKDRATLQGTNITAEANTLGATSEPGHSLGILYDDVAETYPATRWWSWTPPVDGAAAIDLDQAHIRAGVIVYTGGSLDELVEVWNSSQGDDGFFVTKGVPYQIAFGTSTRGPAGFTLRMIAPVAPFLRVQPYAGGPVQGPVSQIYEVGETLGLTLEAQGTEFLHYQWRKDGVDIPNATHPFLGVWPLELKDAGAYSVLVSNKVGTVLSEQVQITVLQQRPHLPDIMRGTWTQQIWTQQNSGDHVIVNFSDSEFSVTLPSTGASAGRGTYRLTATPHAHHYRLVMTYTEVGPGDVEDYVITLHNPQQVPYAGKITPSGSPPIFGISGTFTRIP